MQVRALLCDAADEHAPPIHEYDLPIDERADSQYCDARYRTNLSPHEDVDALSVLNESYQETVY